MGLGRTRGVSSRWRRRTGCCVIWPSSRRYSKNAVSSPSLVLMVDGANPDAWAAVMKATMSWGVVCVRSSVSTLWRTPVSWRRSALRVLTTAARVAAVYLSLSRLNHGQPGVQAHPEIVQGTAELHHEIADALLPQADPVFHNATALHTAVDMLDPQSAVVEHLVGPLLLQGQLRTAGLLRRHQDLDLG